MAASCSSGEFAGERRHEQGAGHVRSAPRIAVRASAHAPAMPGERPAEVTAAAPGDAGEVELQCLGGLARRYGSRPPRRPWRRRRRPACSPSHAGEVGGQLGGPPALPGRREGKRVEDLRTPGWAASRCAAAAAASSRPNGVGRPPPGADASAGQCDRTSEELLARRCFAGRAVHVAGAAQGRSVSAYGASSGGAKRPAKSSRLELVVAGPVKVAEPPGPIDRPRPGAMVVLSCCSWYARPRVSGRNQESTSTVISRPRPSCSLDVVEHGTPHVQLAHLDAVEQTAGLRAPV